MKKTSNDKIAVMGLRGFPGIQGGVESHCYEIWSRIAATGEHNAVVYRRRPYVDKNNVTLPGITFRDLPSTRLKGFEALWHSFLATTNIIRRRECRTVCVHNIGPGIFTPLLRLFGHKVVLTYHSPNYEHKKWGWMGRNVLRMGERLSLRFASRIIFVNRFQMEKFPEKVRRRSVFIPNGINKSTRTDRTDFLQSHGLTPGRYILAVGRLTPEKGFDTLIRSAQQLPEGYRLAIAGAADHDISNLDKLKALDTSGKVVFTGFTQGDDLRQLYSHARLFVLSSVNEGFPIVMLEAMSYGLPMVVTDINGTRLLPSSTDGRYPIYVKPAEPEIMAEEIVKALSLPETHITYDVADYDWDTIARRTLDVITDTQKRRLNHPAQKNYYVDC